MDLKIFWKTKKNQAHVVSVLFRASESNPIRSMHPHHSNKYPTAFCTAILMLVLAGFTHAQSADHPKESIAGLESAWAATKNEPSATRKRLAIKRVLGDARELVVKSCQEVIASHSQSQDLWIVRNRLIVALQGLAKLEPKVASHLNQAIEVAKAAIAAPHPDGTDVIARLCLAREP